MCLNPVNEEFDRAYANVGLLASDVWSFEKELVDYKKANLNLWIRFNETEQRLVEEESDDGHSVLTDEIRTVRDIIPYSRLASYNDYSYNEERERMYFNDDEPAQYIQNSFQVGKKDLEVWMLPEVEEEFKRLTNVSSSRWCSLSPRIPTGREIAPVQQVVTVNPFQWLTKTTWPDQLLARYPDLPRALQDSRRLSLFRGDLMPPSYNTTELEEKLEEFPCPRYLIETNADLELHTRIDSQAIRDLWGIQDYHYGGFSPCFGLNADVPEFRPVTFRQQYPSIYDGSYEAELFPYSNGTVGYQMQQDVTSNDEPIQNIPVFLRPPESYFNDESLKSNWKKQEAVLSNLLTLTDSEKWLNKVYNPRSSDFAAISSTATKIDQIFQSVQQNYCMRQESFSTRPLVSPQRPLYSDVLMSEAGTVAFNDSKYDELEREALEQYSGSDTTLRDILSSPPKQKQSLGKENKSHYAKSSPRSKPSYWDSKSSTKGSKQRVRLADFSPRRFPHQSPRSVKACTSPTTESKRCFIGEASQISCNTNKQAMWMKKKKKKQEKKKKCQKQKRKSTEQNNSKFIESELMSISKFLELNDLFVKTFFVNDWSLAISFFAEETINSFNECFKLFKECLAMFKHLIKNKELKEEPRFNKKRLDFTANVVETLASILTLLHQYINCFSKLKRTIPCDQRLYFDPEKPLFKKQLPVFEQETHDHYSSLNEDECIQSVDYFIAIFNGKYITKLLNGSIHQQCWAFLRKREWKLPFNCDTICNKKSHCIQMINKEGSFHLVLDEKQVHATNTTRKLVRLVDNFPFWKSGQWKFTDGWMFGESLHFSFNWLNKFSVDSLENFASCARVFIIYDWVFKFIDAIFLPQKDPVHEMLWDVRSQNLVSSKMVFMKSLVKREGGWFLGELRINKQGCRPWIAGCESPCCVSWILNYSPADTNANASEQPIVKKTRKSKTTSQKVLEEKKEDGKTKGYSKSKQKATDRKISPEKQMILNKIASGEINLPQEKQALNQNSICVIQ